MSQWSDNDTHFMSRALALAERGRYTVGVNPMVGCVIVRDGKVVAEAFHERTGQPHAEKLAIRQAGERAQGATVYITLEPCAHQGRTPPCTPVLVEAGVKRTVLAMQDPNPEVCGQGIAQLESAGITVDCGLLAEQARHLNRGFVSRMERGRPWLRIKSAISLDGHIALSSGASAWISSEASRRDVQLWRAASGAILTSSRTVKMDNPQLNVRLSTDELEIEGAVRQPLRVVLDTNLSTSPSAKVYHPDGCAVVATCYEADSSNQINQFKSKEIQILKISSDQSGVSLLELLEALATRFEINEVQVEAGTELFSTIIDSGLCDELLLYIAPCLLGEGSQNLARFNDIIQVMEQRIDFRYREVIQIGSDLRVVAEPCQR